MYVQLIHLCLSYRISAFKMIIINVAVEVEVRQLPDLDGNISTILNTLFCFLQNLEYSA